MAPKGWLFKSIFLLIPIVAATSGAAFGQKPSQDKNADRNPAADYYNRGNERQKSGDLDGAIEDYTFAITFDSKFAMAWNNRGVIHYLKGDLDKAIADCGKALELKPDYAEAWNHRGNARLDKGDLAGAVADFDRAISL
ncbi:MAG TPA: tetratricopeptide repeat protein, partial [Blastocatellia bacterium]|nr:tetratricopeptide repeat protein [Blastocatellia bacterium]